MISEETLSDVFRYFKEYKKLDIEYTDSWKLSARDGLEFRCADRNITEDEIIWNLFNDEIMEKYEPMIDREIIIELAKFYDVDIGNIYETK